MLRMIPLRLLSLSKFHAQSTPLFGVSFGGHGCSSTGVTEILQNQVGVSKPRKICHGFRIFCTSTDLSAKKCVPCNSKDMRPMNEETANDLVSKVPGWKLASEEGKLKLTRSWKVKSFTKGLQFFQAVANIAESEGHHPDLHLVGWNNVTIELCTHSIGGVTENDFILAAKINGLDLAHLLRRQPNAE